jgi:hypothetical protein
MWLTVEMNRMYKNIQQQQIYCIFISLFYLSSCFAWLQHFWFNLSANIPVTDKFHWRIQRGSPGIRTPTFVRKFCQEFCEWNPQKAINSRGTPIWKPTLVVEPHPHPQPPILTICEILFFKSYLLISEVD